MPRLPLSSPPSVQTLPRDTEEGRALLQNRLARYGSVGAWLAGVFLLITTTTGLMVGLPDTRAAGIALLASFVVASAISRLATSERALSPTLLVVIDYGFTWINTGIFIGFGFALPLFARPELIQLMLVTDLLAARAFLVPSTARRTALVAAGPVTAVVLSTYYFYVDGPPHPDAPGLLTYLQVSLVLGLVPIVVTAWTSHTIFGLRERAREAMQLGQYTLLEKIGAGGMGVVYKARHATLRRPTAIKLLPAEKAGSHNLARFEREVQLTSTLTHPNTVAIFDYGRSANGILYYAMEYLDGLDLESLVALTGPMPDGRVVHVLAQVASALAEAHEAGIMHRDIKPQNILLCTRGGMHDFAKVVDFGLVKELGTPGTASLSLAGTVVGTPLYMCPEAIVRPSELDARGDLYALGAVGYF
ncbi:MAG TPA: serine/threonine-protein kinase, partial [Polyangiales bacterium]